VKIARSPRQTIPTSCTSTRVQHAAFSFKHCTYRLTTCIRNMGAGRATVSKDLSHPPWHFWKMLPFWNVKKQKIEMHSWIGFVASPVFWYRGTELCRDVLTRLIPKLISKFSGCPTLWKYPGDPHFKYLRSSVTSDAVSQYTRVEEWLFERFTFVLHYTVRSFTFVFFT